LTCDVDLTYKQLEYLVCKIFRRFFQKW
jgi:hypothetical protein